MWDSVLVVCWVAIGIEAGVPATGSGLEHHHHHHHHTLVPGPQLERAPLSVAAYQDDRRSPLKEGDQTCPNCVPHPHPHSHHTAKHHRRPSGGGGGGSGGSGVATLSPRLEAIKAQILSKLGLAARPNVTLTVSRQVVQDTIERADSAEGQEEETPPPTTRLPQETSEPDDFYGRTREIITFAEPGFDSTDQFPSHMLNGQTLLEFPHPRTQEGEGAVLKVKSATLWVKVRPVHSEGYGRALNMTLWIFRVAPSRLRNASYLSGKEFDEHTEMSASLPVTLSSLGWQRFELASTVRQWYDAASQQRLRLLVDCSGCTNLVEAVLFQGASSDRPYLVVHTESIATRRVRRRAIDCQGNNTLCCKERFYVSFRELGWDDWIIAPSGYFANYCRGDCGGGGVRTPDMIASHHAHVIEEYRKMDRLNGMQPCCAPLKFSSMSLIYFGPDMTIIKRDLPKMVVDECGCP